MVPTRHRMVATSKDRISLVLGRIKSRIAATRSGRNEDGRSPLKIRATSCIAHPIYLNTGFRADCHLHEQMEPVRRSEVETSHRMTGKAANGALDGITCNNILQWDAVSREGGDWARGREGAGRRGRDG